MAGEEAIRFLSPEFSQLVALSTVIFAFLYRTTGNRELVIGTPIANRSHALAATCGLVMEQLFLKVEIEDNETFASLARKVRTDLAASLRHGQYCVSDRGLDFASINLIKHTPREFSGLRTKVDFRESWAFASASRELMGGESHNGFAVHVRAFPAGDELVMGLDFDKGTFDPPLRATAYTHFERLFDALLSDLDNRIGVVDLLDEAARTRLLAEGRGERSATPALDVVDAIAAQAARRATSWRSSRRPGSSPTGSSSARPISWRASCSRSG